MKNDTYNLQALIIAIDFNQQTIAKLFKKIRVWDSQ